MNGKPSGARKEYVASGEHILGSDRAVRELLDHIARELAEEYVRLMKRAAAGETDPALDSRGKRKR